MKLHLPKLLLTAVMAALMVPSSWAGSWNGNTYSVGNDGTIETLKTGDNATDDGVFIRAGADAVIATITTLEHVAGKKLTISGTWGNATGSQGGQGYDLANLSIGTLKIGDGTGSAALEIGTSMQSSDTQTPEMQYVTIGAISGSVTSLNIGKRGSLTLTSVDSITKITSTTVDGILDLTNLTFKDNSGGAHNLKLVNFMNAASGAGVVKLKSGSAVQTEGTRTAVTLNTNYVVEGDASAQLVLTSHHDNNAWRTWTIGESGSITVGSGLGTLEFLAGQKAIINGGSITVGTLALGHTSPSTGAASYSGALEMRGSGSTLTVGKIKVQNANTDYANRKNEVVITGGTLKVTGETAIEYVSNANTTVLIGGTGTDSVILQTGSNNWILSKGAATGSSLEIGNITIDAANEKMITITDAYLNGLITNNATNDEAGLTLSGAFTTGDGFKTISYTGNKNDGFKTVVTLTGLGTSANTILSDGITFDGLAIGDAGWQKGADGYYYQATEVSNLLHVYGTTNIDDNIYQAGTNFIGFEVHSGATLNIAGHEVQGLKVYLNENATLANNGSAIGETKRQYDQVILKGNAYADTAANFGLLAGSYKPTTLDLARYTLTKKGTAEFVLVNTTVEAGTIDVQQGGLKLVAKEGGSITLKDGVNINVASGAFVNLATGDLTSDQILAITGAGEVRINNTITLGEGTAALSGTFVTASGSLTINGTTIGALRTNGGSSTVANGSVTNLTSAGGTTNVRGGSVTTLSATGGTTNVSGGSVATLSTTGGTINVTGGSITTVKMKGSGNQNLNFKLAAGATSASYTLGSLSTIDTDSYGCNITIDSGVTVEANSVTPGWGFGTITVNGSLKLSEMLELATGRNNDTTRNVITGSGIIDTKKLSIGNIGTYNISGVTMKIGEGGIKKGTYYDAGSTKTNLGAMTIEAKADWDSDVDTLKLVATGSDSTVINTAGHTVALKAGLGGTGNLTKTGEGTLKIGENSTTFTSGAVTVSGGKLELNNATAGTSYTISSLTLDGGALDVTGTLTLSNVTVDLSKYTAGTEVELVKAGAYGENSNFDWTLANADAVGNYAASLDRRENSVWLTWQNTTPSVSSITTSVSTAEGWYTLSSDGTTLTLTLTVDRSLAGLAADGSVMVNLLTDEQLSAIMGDANCTNPYVLLELTDSDNNTVAADAFNKVVFIKGDTGQNYWGEMVGNQLMYNVERIPEPASATLSLAALMMLCARRRRRA